MLFQTLKVNQAHLFPYHKDIIRESMKREKKSIILLIYSLKLKEIWASS